MGSQLTDAEVLLERRTNKNGFLKALTLGAMQVTDVAE